MNINPNAAAVQNLPVSRKAGLEAALPQGPSLRGAVPTRDEARLAARPESPYAALGAEAAQVRVEPWGRSPNSTLEGLLQSQGYTRDEIYRRGRDGRRLVDHVARVNELRDPNLVYPGQRLTVPVKPEEAAPAPPRTAPPAAQQDGSTAPRPPAAPPTREEAPPTPPRPADPSQARPKDMVSIRVDRWGEGPNSTVEDILRSQGYSLQEIYRKDRQGQTMVDKASRWNGLRRPEDLRSGQVFQVPPKPGRRPAPPGRDTLPKPPGRDTAPTTPERDTAPRPPEGGTDPNPPEKEGLTVEMGLILDGVKDGRLTRDEFKGLNTAANRYEELRARYARDGYTPAELATLGRHEKIYGQMYARFVGSDRSTVEFKAGQPDDPKVRRRVEMTEEGGRIFDLYSTGRLALDDALERLRLQRLAARELGEAG